MQSLVQCGRCLPDERLAPGECCAFAQLQHLFPTGLAVLIDEYACPLPRREFLTQVPERLQRGRVVVAADGSATLNLEVTEPIEYEHAACELSFAQRSLRNSVERRLVVLPPTIPLLQTGAPTSQGFFSCLKRRYVQIHATTGERVATLYYAGEFAKAYSYPERELLLELERSEFGDTNISALLVTIGSYRLYNEQPHRRPDGVWCLNFDGGRITVASRMNYIFRAEDRRPLLQMGRVAGDRTKFVLDFGPPFTPLQALLVWVAMRVLTP